jgi:hypothetical protein
MTTDVQENTATTTDDEISEDLEVLISESTLMFIATTTAEWRDNVLIPSGVCTLEEIQADTENKFQPMVCTFFKDTFGLDLEAEGFVTPEHR